MQWLVILSFLFLFTRISVNLLFRAAALKLSSAGLGSQDPLGSGNFQLSFAAPELEMRRPSKF
jgi:hypothetical protein